MQRHELSDRLAGPSDGQSLTALRPFDDLAAVVPEIPNRDVSHTKNVSRVIHNLPSLLALVASLITLGSGGGLATVVWQVWAATGDGERFMVKQFSDEGTARYTIEAFESQLRVEDPVEWARSKDWVPLAEHL